LKRQRGQEQAVQAWDIPIGRRRLTYGWSAPELHCYQPLAAAELPVGCLEALWETVGEVFLPQLLILPPRVHRQNWRTRVCAPRQVLAFGNETVALWVDMFGVQLRIALSDLDQVRDAADGRSRVLELRSAARRITVRYSPSDRHTIMRFAAGVRRRAAAVPLPMPALRPLTARQARRWQDTLEDSGHPGEDVAVVTGRRLLTRAGSTGRHSAFAVSPYELVIAQMASSGSTIPRLVVWIPRGRLTRVTSAGVSLKVMTGGGMEDTAGVGRALVARARREFGSVLPGRAAPAAAASGPTANPSL
jgi:hypothetical protein